MQTDQTDDLTTTAAVADAPPFDLGDIHRLANEGLLPRAEILVGDFAKFREWTERRFGPQVADSRHKRRPSTLGGVLVRVDPRVPTARGVLVVGRDVRAVFRLDD